MSESVSPPSPIVRVRNVSRSIEVHLSVSAGGCCQFRGCNKYLFEHPITKSAGNFSQKAHIVAFSENGPRGSERRPEDIHVIDNLMLLCTTCHKLVDDDADRFTVPLLMTFKREHEDRIRRAVTLSPDHEVVVCVLKAPIRGQHVAVPKGHVLDAISPWWPSSSTFCEIDLSALDGSVESGSFHEQAATKITREVERMFREHVENTPRLAVFAIAPIPLLVHFGASLENKIPTRVYQRHRDTEDWRWKASGDAASFETLRLQHKPGESRIALIMSLSGTIALDALPAEVRGNASIYEMRLTSADPCTTFLRTERDFEEFVRSYHALLAMISADHGHIDEIDVFPAIPAPIAIAIGRERLAKCHPSLNVYDFDRANDGFSFQLKVH